MLERVKKALVESYIGAIGVGWIFAQGLINLVGAVVTPLSVWFVDAVGNHQNGANSFDAPEPAQFSLAPAVPSLMWAAMFLLLSFILLRWLYMQPPAYRRQWIFAGKLIARDGFTISFRHHAVVYSDERGNFEIPFEDNRLLSAALHPTRRMLIPLTVAEKDAIVERTAKALCWYSKKEIEVVDAVE